MKKIISLILSLWLLVFSSPAQYLLEKGFIEIHQTNESEGMLALSFKNLKIYPLFAGDLYVDAHKEIGDFKTLKEALAEGMAEIKETGNEEGAFRSNNFQMQGVRSGNVNELLIRNLSDDTLFLMAGELISGGKQDRVIAQNYLIPPGEEFTPIAVFCVEQGRWAYTGKDDFSKHNSFSSNSVRAKAVVNKNQSAVWSQVEEVTVKNKATTKTGNFNAVYENEEFMSDFNLYKAHFVSEMAKLKGCIGMVGVSGNRIIGSDIFATEDLFLRQFESLTAAYITEAITEGKPANLSDEAVEDYLRSFLAKNINQDEVIDNNGSSFKYKNKKLHIAKF